MLTASKFALIATIVLGTALSASAATRAQAVHEDQVGNQATSSDVIPGYGKDGNRVAIPNPDR
jgi:hypothetical protein